ncbi:MAG: hypothetical protein IPJ34_36430 [Myxococcales bacterium]|nr:hypothetical protein [Myxococcales bacterium]
MSVRPRKLLVTLSTLAAGPLFAVVVGLGLAPACTKGAPPASLLDSGTSASSSGDLAASASSSALSAPLDAGPPPAPVDELQARAKKLFEAIQKDEPDLAMALFYPRDPYLAMKDVKDPGALWDKNVKEYKAHIHSYHKRLGKKSAEAEFESLELNTKSQVYVAPKKELNKTGYNKATKSSSLTSSRARPARWTWPR